MAKLNSNANIFGISFLRSGISQIDQNYEKVCSAIILNHKIAICKRYLCVKGVWRQRLENGKIVVNHFALNTCESYTNIWFTWEYVWNQVPAN